MEERKPHASNNSDLADFFLCNQSHAKSDQSEANDSDNISIYLPRKRKNLKQPKDISGKFYRTLPGYLIQLIESQGPMQESELIEVLGQQLPSLRNTCGSVYKNAPVRCLNGICKMPIFIVRDQVWSLNEEEVPKYRDRFLQKRMHKKKVVEIDKRGIKKSEKIISILRSYSQQLAKDPRTEILIKDPLKELNGNEDLAEASKKVGYERLIGILQSYAVVSKYYIQRLKKEDNPVHFNNIERDIDGIYSKLSRIEGHLVRYSVTESKSESIKY